LYVLIVILLLAIGGGGLALAGKLPLIN